MWPLVQPMNRREPAVSWQPIGATSCTCQFFDTAFHTPTRPLDAVVTNEEPMKNMLSMGTPRSKLSAAAAAAAEALADVGDVATALLGIVPSSSFFL